MRRRRVQRRDASAAAVMDLCSQWPARGRTATVTAAPPGRCVRRVVSGSVSIERINPGELAQPSGFSHAVTATGGRLVFLAGQTALDHDGSITGSSVAEQ